MVVAMTLPRNPATQVHPVGTLVPELFSGQLIGTHRLQKNGDVEIAITSPLNPGLQLHLPATSSQMLFLGQVAREQLEE